MKKVIILLIVFLVAIVTIVLYTTYDGNAKIGEQAQTDIQLYQDKFDNKESYIYTEEYADLSQTFQFEEKQIYDSKTDTLKIEYHEANVGNQNTYDIEISYTLTADDKVEDYQAKINGEEANDDQEVYDKLVLYRDEEFEKPQKLIDNVYNSVSGEELSIEYEDGYYTNVGKSSADEIVTQTFDNQGNILNSLYESEYTSTAFTLEFTE